MTYFPAKPSFHTPNAVERNQMFGTFQYRNNGDGTIRILGAWESQNIIRVEIPQIIGVEAAPKDGVVRFHKKGAAQLQGFFQAIEDEGLQDLILTWAGSFYPRFIRGSKTSLSNHSWGTAFDINAAWNGLNRQPAAVGAKGSVLKLVPIANDFGFFWGGHYNSRLDGMHFELAVVNKFRKSFQVLNTANNDEPVVLEIEKTLPVESQTAFSNPQSEPSKIAAEIQPASQPDAQATANINLGGDVPPKVDEVLPGTTPTDEAQQVSQAKVPSRIYAALGTIGAVIAAIKGFVSDNALLIGIGILCVTFLFLALIFRGVILDWLRMRLASDPKKYNVK